MNAKDRIVQRMEGPSTYSLRNKLREKKPPKRPKKEVKNGGKIAKVLGGNKISIIEERNKELIIQNGNVEEENKKLVKRNEAVEQSFNRFIASHSKVPIAYYFVMAFGLVFAIWGALKVGTPAQAYSIIISGIGIFAIALFGYFEIKSSSTKIKGNSK